MKAITTLRREVGALIRNSRYGEMLLDEFSSLLGESIATGRKVSTFPEINGRYLLSLRGRPYARMLARSQLVEKANSSSSAPWILTEKGERFYQQGQQGRNNKAVMNCVRRQVQETLNIDEMVVNVASELQGTILYNKIEEEAPEQGKYRVEPLGLEGMLTALGLATKRHGGLILTRKAERLYQALDKEGYYDIKD